jgi:hypothetical protein
MTDEAKLKNFTSAEELREVLMEIHNYPKKERVIRLSAFLAKKFGLDGDELSGLKALQLLMELVRRVENEASALDLDDRYKTQIVADTKFLTDKIWALGSNIDLNNFVSNIPLNRVETLRYVEMVLSSSCSYTNLDAESAEVVSALEELSNEIVVSGLPDQLKASVSIKLNEIRQSVNMYRIWGIEAIEKDVFSLTGELVVNSAVDVSIKKDPVTKRITRIMGGVFDFIGKARKATDDSGKLFSAGKKIIENILDM